MCECHAATKSGGAGDDQAGVFALPGQDRLAAVEGCETNALYLGARPRVHGDDDVRQSADQLVALAAFARHGVIHQAEGR